MQKPLSPLDGRYLAKVNPLTDFFSEFAYCKFRIQIEVEWLIYIIQNLYHTEAESISKNSLEFLQKIYLDFDEENFTYFQELEKKTKHDLKAIEYYIKEKIQKTALVKYQELIHICLTSDDINNIAQALMLKGAWENILRPQLANFLQQLAKLADSWRYDAMLARTHGQPASPTTVGKEVYNFVYRLYRQFCTLQNQTFFAKLNGATGNYQAHIIAFPNVDWIEFTKKFIQSFGLTPNPATTQIEPHDYIVEFFQTWHHLHSILIGFTQDIWNYISLDYLGMQLEAGQVGSSVMPHKINPIDFENAEGNLGLANGLLEFFIRKLPISRMQRDLSDSTVLRNIGVALGHSLLGLKSLQKGTAKLKLNTSALNKDLRQHWEVLAEPLQTVLRKNFIDGAYEKIRSVSQDAIVKAADYKKWVANFDIPKKEKAQLLSLTPETYIGNATNFEINFILRKIKKYAH